MHPLISIVIPVFNEEELIQELYERTVAALEAFTPAFEIICVNDGSTDRTLELLKDFHQKDPRFKVLSLSRNFGHQSAILAGLNFAQGDYVGIMDGDLQDPPEIFKAFYDKSQEGYDVVYAIRKKRKEGLLKKGAYWIYYRILISISKMKIPVDSGDFCLISKRALKEMLKIEEQSLFIRGLRHWVGFKQTGLVYERASRKAGEPKYNLRKLFKLAYNGVFSFSDFPIKLLGRIGMLTLIISVLYATYLLTKRFVWGDVPEGFSTLILAIFFFGGVQLVSIRILGEYIHRTYDESRNRPLYIVEESYLD